MGLFAPSKFCCASPIYITVSNSQLNLFFFKLEICIPQTKYRIQSPSPKNCTNNFFFFFFFLDFNADRLIDKMILHTLQAPSIFMSPTKGNLSVRTKSGSLCISNQSYPEKPGDRQSRVIHGPEFVSHDKRKSKSYFSEMCIC